MLCIYYILYIYISVLTSEIKFYTKLIAGDHQIFEKP